MRQLSALLLAMSLSLFTACGTDTAPEPAASTQAPATEATPEPPPEPVAEAVPLALQAASSELTFSARKNDEVDVVGTFTRLSGSLSVPGGDLGKARGSIEIGFFGGVDTTDPNRDANVVSTFFGALDDSGPKGQASLNNFEVKMPNLGVGESTAGNAFVDVGAGASMMGLAVPVRIERLAENQYKVTLTEPAELSIDKLGMGERKSALMTLCEHKSVGDGIKVSGAFLFGE